MKTEYLVKNRMKPELTEFIRITRSHPKVREGLLKDTRITRIQQEEWYNEVYSKDEDFEIYVIKALDGDKVGYVQFHYDWHHRSCEVGFVIHPDYQGCGYGKNATNWALYYLEQQEKIKRVWLTVFPNNKAAISLYKRCGFEKEGELRSAVFKGGRYRNLLVMSKLI